MPKEYVENPYVGTNMDTGEDVPLNTFRVEVGWSRETGSVRVATTNPEADPFTVGSGLFVDLNRRSINDLIRLLRKARDQSFGRDE